MIKRIIFDLDNTLIDFPKNFEDGYKKVLLKHNLSNDPKDLYKVIGLYENNDENKFYDKTRLLELINNTLNTSLDSTFISDFFEMYNNLSSNVPESVKETLEYLSSKYELFILSNWFTDSQKARMKNAGILNFFKEVYGTDIVPMKPRRESFMSLIDNLNPNECVMIGDNLEVDIKVPYELGFNVYHLNKNGTSKYPTIRKIEELKEML